MTSTAFVPVEDILSTTVVVNDHFESLSKNFE